MEYLHGLDAESLVDRYGPQPAGRVLSFLRQACESLEEAHDAGLIHRDIKPSNLFICRLGKRTDFVKVVDFGLVKELARRSEDRTDSESRTSGTPAFMAPEQVRGEEVDARTDIYGLGCLAYFLLTGTVVFNKPNSMAMAVAHLNEQPEPPSTRSELPISAIARARRDVVPRKRSAKTGRSRWPSFGRCWTAARTSRPGPRPTRTTGGRCTGLSRFARRRDERRRPSPAARQTGMAMVVSSLTMAYQVAGKASRDAIFLSQFKTTDLPAMVTVAAIAAIVVSIASSRTLVRLGPHRVAPVSFALSGVLQFAEWLLLGHSARIAACVIYLHVVAFGAVLSRASGH